MNRVLPSLLAATLLALPAAAQVPDTLRHVIPAAPMGVQSGASFGNSVALDGNYLAIGVPGDDEVGMSYSGVVRVFDAATGALLFTIPNPSPAMHDFFGCAVALSGTRLVVGARYEGTQTPAVDRVHVYDIASGTPTVPVFALDNPDPTAFDKFGASVAISGTRVVVGAPGDDFGADGAGSAYVFDLAGATPATAIATLHNPAPMAYDSFGTVVSLAGPLVVVGVPFDDDGFSNSGSVYVYHLDHPSPEQPWLSMPNPAPDNYDAFGFSVAVSGTLMVLGELGSTDAGSAFVYDLASTVPDVPALVLSQPAPVVGDAFGSAVGIAGTRVVVTAVGAQAGGIAAGKAYIYELNSATPTTAIATLSNPTGTAYENWGLAAAISATRVVIGSPLDSSRQAYAGSAYVYDFSLGVPAGPLVKLEYLGTAPGDAFGQTLALSGARMVVGLPADSSVMDRAGSAHIYDLASANPTVPVLSLANPTPAPLDHFGSSVGISGFRAVVGAFFDSTDADLAGIAYVYDLRSTTPAVPALTLHHPNPGVNEQFGHAVSMAGNRVVVGSYFDDMGATHIGTAYVFDLGAATPTVPVAALSNPGPTHYAGFAWSVAVSGTIVVVGAPFDDTGATTSGRAYVYDLAGGAPTVPLLTLDNPTPFSGAVFGYSVAVSGSRFVVGAYGANSGASRAGAAYVYDLNSATPTAPVATLNHPSPSVNAYYGWSVAISANRVVVGAYGDDTGAADSGVAYVYDLLGSTPTAPVVTLNNPTPAASDGFGSGVAIEGAMVSVGAPRDDATAEDKGAAYVFAPANPDYDGDGLLDLWEYARFGTTTGHSALDDSDGDGRKELLELAFDTDPLFSDPMAAPAVVDEGGFLTITLNKRAGVSYTVETAGSPDGAAFSMGTTTIITNDASTLKVRDNFTPSTAVQRYMRVKVTAVP